MNEAAIFEFPYNLFLMERLEFVLICQDEWEAKILRLIEYDMAKQKEAWQNRVAEAIEQKKTPPKEPKEYWVRLSHTQIIARLYRFDSKKVGAKHPLSLSKSTVRNLINTMIDKKFIFMRSKPGDEFGAPLYTLNRPLLQEKIKQLSKEDAMMFLMGVPNFESGGELESLELGVPENVSGELENSEVPVTESASPQLENSEVFKEYSNNDKNLEEENERERVASATSARTLSDTENDSQQGDDDASSVALPAVAPSAQPTDSPAGIPADLLGAGTLRRDTVPEATAVPAQAPFKTEMGTLTKGHHEIPHADPSDTALEPVVSATHAQDGSCSIRPGAGVPTREFDAGVPARSGVSECPREKQTPFSVTSPSDGAVGSAPPSSGPRASGRRNVTQAIQLSLQGAQVKEWMETIKGRKLRMTPKNVKACNSLADEDEMSLDNLRDVIELWEKTQWVIDHNYVITLQVLAQEDGAFTFEKGMDIVRRKRKSKDPVAAGKTVSGYQYYVKPTSAKVVVI